MTKPVRLQLSRRKGFDLQALSRARNGLPALKVTRPHELSNPFRITGPHKQMGSAKDGSIKPWWVETDSQVWMFETKPEAQAASVKLFRAWFKLPAQATLRERCVLILRRTNPACFCAPEDPCHVDVLLEVVNQ